MSSRQRRWQVRMNAQDRCEVCGKRAYTKHHCRKHAEARRAMSKKYELKHKDYYRAYGKEYRLGHRASLRGMFNSDGSLKNNED